MTITFDYEALMADFNRKLVTQLRGHSADSEYLETWVPDEDPVRSVLNMVEAALSAGVTDMRIDFAAGTLDPAQQRVLLEEVTKIADARLERCGSGGALFVAAPKD